MIAKKVQEEPIALERYIKMKTLMDEHQITTKELAIHCSLALSTLQWYRAGRIPITDFKWVLIEKSLDKLIAHKKYSNENRKVKHDISSLDLIEEYMIVSIGYHYNTIVKKHKIKGVEKQFIKQLRKAGFECQLRDTGSDHYVVEGKAIRT